MDIRITARHGHLPQEVQDHVLQKAAKLGHWLPKNVHVRVTVDLHAEHGMHTVEAEVPDDHHKDLFAKEVNPDYQVALDAVLAKLESQARKLKEKITDHRHKH